MDIDPFAYPQPDVLVLPLDDAFKQAYQAPPGKLFDPWPPRQAEYLRVYLREMGCTTAVIEKHYIDRVFMHDDAIFYVRNLRAYPNSTKRISFFTLEFDLTEWRSMISRAARGQFPEIQTLLQEHYRGFTIVRPLPDCPYGAMRK